MFKTTLRSALLLSSLALFQSATAQNLPGVAIETATVAADLQSLFTLAEQAYPGSIPAASASGWRLYQGYTFKYYAATGIYVGIKDGQVYLLGGPYTSITPYGSTTAIASALQARIDSMGNQGSTTADFGNVLYVKTVNDLTTKFESITMEYGTRINSALLTGATVKLDFLGQETVDTVATTHFTATITGSGASQVYDLWVDGSGTYKRAKLGSFEYPSTLAQTIGVSAVSGFLIALAAMDNAQVKAALSGELQSPALSTKVTKRIVGNSSYDTIKIEVGAGTDASSTSYITDFGSFTMMTEISSRLFTQENFFEFIDIKLR